MLSLADHTPCSGKGMTIRGQWRGKDVERSDPGLNRGTRPPHLCRNWEISGKTSVSIVIYRTEVWTRDISNKLQWSYCSCAFRCYGLMCLGKSRKKPSCCNSYTVHTTARQSPRFPYRHTNPVLPVRYTATEITLSIYLIPLLTSLYKT